MITLALLKSVFKTTSEATLSEYVEPLNRLLPLYKINTPARVAAFLAQTGHESGNYSTRIENLNYGEAGLLKTFKKYFTPALAKAYARQPIKIANRVYANRMMNGNEASGDGWRFRGKGLIQTTGKENHVNFAKFAEMTLEDATAYMLTPAGAILSAIWFWGSRNLNAYADKGDITGMTKIINGGTNGLEDRKALYAKFKALL